MVKFFIDRPVFSTVISIIFILMGALSITQLPIEKYPNMAPPTIRVEANYTGASAETVERTVAIPIEEEINGVENMIYFKTTCSNDGRCIVDVTFAIGTDGDIAAVNTQNRVTWANPRLPPEVLNAGITVKKRQTNLLTAITLLSPNKTHNEEFLANYCKINLIPTIKRIKGVGDATLLADKEYAMRIWLNPDKMAQLSLNIQEVENAIKEQNIEAAPGKIGGFPAVQNQMLEIAIKSKERFKTPEEFENIIVRTTPQGGVVRIKDIGEVELGSKTYTAISRFNNGEAPTMTIYQLSDANAVELVEKIRAKMDELKEDFPVDMDYEVPYDTTRLVTESIKAVVETLIIAFLLIFLVVYVFIQNWRSTLIPCIAVPVSIIGTFFFMQSMGYSINLLTLFGLILAIGTVVDDAIVVVEAVEKKMAEDLTISSYRATINAMGEIVGPIISTSLVMIAVFLPMAFISGSTGIMYRQFAITICSAIVISTINALSLSPVLCSIILKRKDENEPKKTGLLQKFFNGFNKGFKWYTDKYMGITKYLANRTKLAILILFGLSGIGVWLYSTLPQGLVPDEDGGYVFMDIQLPPGSSLERTDNVVKKVEKVFETTPGVRNFIVTSGYSFLLDSYAASRGLGIIELDHWDDRKKKELQLKSIIAGLQVKLQDIKEANVILFGEPAIPGLGNASGFTFQLRDQGAQGVRKLYDASKKFIEEVTKRKEILYASNSLDVNFPQYRIDIDETKAKRLGLNIDQILLGLQSYFSGSYISNFNRFGKLYRVYVQAESKFRQNPEDIYKFKLKNDQGKMVQTSSFITLTKTYGPEIIKRFNLATAASINGAAGPGYSSGQALKTFEDVAKEVLPQGFNGEWSDLAYQEKLSEGQIVFVFIISILFVFLLLSANYESYFLPIAVLLIIPLGVLGAAISLKLAHLENNVFAQVALVMLIGIIAKNAILIVEFVKLRRENGEEIVEAALLGAKDRLRPILMTSFTFILGILPLALASGASAISRNSVGIPSVGGMLIGTLIGVIFAPVTAIIFHKIHEKVAGKKFYEKKEEEVNGNEITQRKNQSE